MIFSTEGAEAAVMHIAEAIAHKLHSNQSVLWFVSGGSAIALQVAVMEKLRESADDKLELITILPVDERFGPFDHVDSNGAQLGQAGFNPYPALWIDILSENTSFEDTTGYYAGLVEDALDKADYSIATLGLGVDGHTAGILPGSIASTDSESSVVGYTWSDYQRITLGLASLKKLQAAFVLSYGESKHDALHRLQANTESLDSLPAKLLYGIPNVTVYNDSLENEGY